MRRPTPRSTAHAGRANGIAGITPERVIREGDTDRGNPQADRRGRGHRDPDPGRRHRQGRARARWYRRSAKTAGDFPIPVAIVPGHLSDEDLDAMS